MAPGTSLAGAGFCFCLLPLATEDLRSYFGREARAQGWHADPSGREQLHVSEARVCVELHPRCC